MKLITPPEPIELKVWMLSLKQSHFQDSSGGGIDWDSFVVWSGNKLPKYLWDHWKVQLKATGLTWQKFMRILRHRTDIGVLWYKGSLPWSEFAASVAKLIDEFQEKGAKASPVSESKPVDLAQWHIPPMREWEKFERLCLDLWKEIWGDPNAQRVGRSGQRQNGVDILGTLPTTGKSVGVQCKKKDATYTDDTLTKNEIHAIVEEAKSFTPPLSELVIAYTGKRDATLQEEARLITEEYRSLGLFSVSLSSWDDILEALGNYDHVFRKHFPLFAGINVDANELNKRIDSPRYKDVKEESFSVRAGLPTAAKRIIKEVAESTADSVTVMNEHDAEIDHARDLLNDMKPKEALDYLEKLEKRIWRNADSMRRFRILTNKASALSSLGQEEVAGTLFIEAFQYNPDDEKALCNRALGHLLLNQIVQAEEFARKVLKKNPASARAYGILVNAAPQTESLEQIIQKIPADLRKKEDVAFAIAYAARKREDIESGIHWLRVTLEDAKKSGKKKNPDLVGTLATTILESFMKKYEVLNGIQLTPEDRAKLEEAITLLTEGINTVTSENLLYRTSWLVNRAAAYKLVGQFDQAVADMETVLRLKPDDAAMIKQYAFMLYSNDQRLRAIGLLRSVLGKPEVPEVALMLAGMLYENGEGDEAKEILEKTPDEGFDQNLKAEMQRLLIQISMRKSDSQGAFEISSKMREANPTNILNLVDAARIEKRTGSMDNAAHLLDEARGYVNEKTPSHHIVELADELYALEKYPDSWPLYEKIADPRVDTPLVRNLLYSYYRSGETEKAVRLSKQIPPENKDSFLIQVELSVLEDIGDLKSATETAERYIESHPDDDKTRIHLATLWFRTDQLEKLDTFLDQDIDVAKLPLGPGFQLVGLYYERSRAEKSLQIAYELRRANFDKGEAHLKYMGAFFGGEHKFDALLESTTEVETGMAVRVTNDAAQDTWYLLEDQEDLNAAMGELSIHSELGKKVIGKKTGDEVVASEGSIEKVVIKITEIKNKYVHALHESMRLLPERFGDTKGFERVTFKSGTEEETRESIQKMLGVVTKRNEWVMQAERFYRESKLTVGAFAQIIHRNIIDVWNGLVGSKWGVKSCLGTLEERKKAFDLLTENRVVAIDITSLLTVERLKIFPMLEKRFDKILIAKSTFHLLLEAISERKGVQSRGFSTIGTGGDGLVREDIPPEVVKGQIEYLERLKKWVRDHCEVTPLKQGLKPETGNDQREMLGPSFLDTILIAKEQKCLLYTDDFGTKMIALNDFGVESFWTQVLLMSMLSYKQVTEDEYYEVILQLVHLKYRHTTINGQIILYAAKKANWSNADTFAEILETLRGTQMEIHSVAGVLVEFMFHLWQQPVLDFQRDVLVMAALEVLSDQRDDRAVVRLMRVAVEIRFRMIPLTEARVQQVISAWEALRIKPRIPGFIG